MQRVCRFVFSTEAIISVIDVSILPQPWSIVSTRLGFKKHTQQFRQKPECSNGMKYTFEFAIQSVSIWEPEFSKTALGSPAEIFLIATFIDYCNCLFILIEIVFWRFHVLNWHYHWNCHFNSKSSLSRSLSLFLSLSLSLSLSASLSRHAFLTFIHASVSYTHLTLPTICSV